MMAHGLIGLLIKQAVLEGLLAAQCCRWCWKGQQMSVEKTMTGARSLREEVWWVRTCVVGGLGVDILT